MTSNVLMGPLNPTLSLGSRYITG